MEYNEKIQKIIDLIEIHLQQREEPVQMEEIENIAGCSLNFFQKVFSYMNGISFAHYIRNRKMTLAGYDLKSTSMKVIEVSYKYGYESPTSFTKAFTAFHQVTPKEAKTTNCSLRVFPKMNVFHKQQFQWRIERKEGFSIVGKSIQLSTLDQQHYQSIPAFWSACQKDGSFARLVAQDTAAEKGMFGLFSHEDVEHTTIQYMIAVQSSNTQAGLFMEIPAMTWAIFDCVGRVPDAIQNGWRFLYDEWLIKYPFRHGAALDMEWYQDGNMFDPNYLSQIWIPIEEE